MQVHVTAVRHSRRETVGAPKRRNETDANKKRQGEGGRYRERERQRVSE